MAKLNRTLLNNGSFRYAILLTLYRYRLMNVMCQTSIGIIKPNRFAVRFLISYHLLCADTNASNLLCSFAETCN